MERYNYNEELNLSFHPTNQEAPQHPKQDKTRTEASVQSDTNFDRILGLIEYSEFYFG